MSRLRAPDGCPWDRQQTLESLKPYLIEESYEVLDAIDRGVPADHCEELGDVLLQIVFQSQIAMENNWFDANDVVDTICTKLIRRHPHVFGNEKASTPEEVVEHWQRIKAAEKKERHESAEKQTPSALDGIPASYPPLLAADRLSRKAAKVGFDWQSYEEVWKKVNEEMQELQEAMALAEDDESRNEKITWELGDLMFALVNLSRHLNIDSSESLRKANQRFNDRFRLVELIAKSRGIDIASADLESLEHLWQEAKNKLKTQEQES